MMKTTTSHPFPLRVRGVVFFFLLPLLTIGHRTTCASPEVQSEKVDVAFSGGPHGSHIIEGRFSITASSQVIWDVLSDYDHLSSFVSSVISSKITKQEDSQLLVEQVMTGKAGIFRKRIYLLLKVDESNQKIISFEDISKKSFKSYLGSWEIQGTGEELQVCYKLNATPDFFSPDFLTDGAFKRSVKLLLEEVRKEILKRENNPT